MIILKKGKIIHELNKYNASKLLDKELASLLKDMGEKIMTDEDDIAKRLNEFFAIVCMKETEGHIPQPGIIFFC